MPALGKTVNIATTVQTVKSIKKRFNFHVSIHSFVVHKHRSAKLRSAFYPRTGHARRLRYRLDGRYRSR